MPESLAADRVVSLPAPAVRHVQALRLQLIQLTPLLAAYPDIAAERQELGDIVEKLPTQTPIDQASSRKRLVELADLIRVQLAAAERTAVGGGLGALRPADVVPVRRLHHGP